MRTDLVRPARVPVYLALAAAIGLTSCESQPTAPGVTGNATLTILLTDAPDDVAEAWVIIDGIYLQGLEECQNGGTTDCDGDQAGRVWLRDTPTDWINLLTLQNDWTALVENTPVEPGSYKDLRFVVTDGVIVTGDIVNGETQVNEVFATPDADMASLAAVRGGDPLVPTGLLHCPSCSKSGIKVKFAMDNLVVEADGETIVYADFDVSESFGKERGTSNRWVMHPVIKAEVMDLFGSIGGMVDAASGLTLPECGGVQVTLQDFVPLVNSMPGVVQTDNTYEFASLSPGTYQMLYELQKNFGNEQLEWAAEVMTAGLTDPVDPAVSQVDVEVVAGAQTVVDYTITGATCQ